MHKQAEGLHLSQEEDLETDKACPDLLLTPPPSVCTKPGLGGGHAVSPQLSNQLSELSPLTQWAAKEACSSHKPSLDTWSPDTLTAAFSLLSVLAS